jgi:hypothetical protein
MTEAHWDSCNDPLQILEFVRGKASDRKLRLFAVGCMGGAWEVADALEDVGCTDASILEHCRSGGEHARGWWVVDLLIGKE